MSPEKLQPRLSERQERILELVVDSYLESGRPVSSRAIASSEEIEWSPSTVRSELAALERTGYLNHPHTSAGRVPTDSGYRRYADSLVAAGQRLPARRHQDLELAQVRHEVDEAMRETTSALARVTDLLALVTAPPPSSARIHRVEVLLLQPAVVMVVVIASNGMVTQRVSTFDEQVDVGLVEWAASYLNERLEGMGLGARMIAGRLADPELSEVERGFLEQIAPAFTALDQRADETLYIDGAARLLSEDRVGEIPGIDALMQSLERRASLLHMLRSALGERSVFLWIGAENPEPELRMMSVVGANYGLGYRNLGAVGVVGPLRMDYATAIASVREAAGELSRYFETVYER
jgi:heat-inducible transcriptional repressor